MMKKGGELGFISSSFDYEVGGLQIPLMASTRIIVLCIWVPEKIITKTSVWKYL